PQACDARAWTQRQSDQRQPGRAGGRPAPARHHLRHDQQPADVPPGRFSPRQLKGIRVMANKLRNITLTRTPGDARGWRYKTDVPEIHGFVCNPDTALAAIKNKAVALNVEIEDVPPVEPSSFGKGK